VLTPAYTRAASPLHAARPAAAAAFCTALALVGMVFDHPLVLAGALGAIALAAVSAGAAAPVWRAARIAIVFALLIAVVNALVTQQGQTLLVRGGELLGHRFDITLEATVYGLVAGVRVLVVVLGFALLSATVDPDELLRAFRRVGPRFTLTAAIATRLAPVLLRDATRMNEAVRCRARPPGRTAVARAALAGALERAVDVAASLEVRGFGNGARPARVHRPRSRHDVRVAAGAAAILLLCAAGLLAGAGSMEAYPRLDLSATAADAVLAIMLPALAALPFAGRRARLGVRVA
jgi:energy-coupling factor transport system permease protein